MAEFIAGDTFLIEGVGDTLHLFVVLCDLAEPPSRVLTVMVSTLRTMSDRTVILKPGEHPFIKHASSVEYGSMRVMPVATLLQLEGMNAGKSGSRSFVRREPLTAEMLNRIVQGALTSDLAAKGMKRLLENWLALNSAGAPTDPGEPPS